ncbi:uncharacterized protein LOC123659783 [Melitaea cinxia]|uniref:uncharacterized protein LOC123659783 n=1 Tax=Melitaea cinxia TaxID=113334 RepID=UPI001E272B32|nr:uncharacterized protein LOC123659783 [Melitaea cinxia]
MSKKKSTYKCCAVPDCKNTTFRTPNKLFFSIPVGERRSAWCKAMGRHEPEYKPLHPNSTRFCCEDHFDLEKDMENYMRWKMMGTRRLSLKKGILPHKFSCQNKVISDTSKQIETAPVDIKQEISDTDDVVACESDVTDIQDTELSEPKDESIDNQCRPYIVSIICVKTKKRRLS